MRERPERLRVCDEEAKLKGYRRDSIVDKDEVRLFNFWDRGQLGYS